jgi:hypothetical protein
MRGLSAYLVIAVGGAVEPEGSAVPRFMAVPLVLDVDVAWSGVGFVFTPGAPVGSPWAACSGVGLVFTPGATFGAGRCTLCKCEGARQCEGRQYCDCPEFHGCFFPLD